MYHSAPTQYTGRRDKENKDTDAKGNAAKNPGIQTTTEDSKHRQKPKVNNIVEQKR